MGILLSCSRDALPSDTAALVIVTPQLTISAVSLAGESIVGPEEDLLGADLLELLTSPVGDDHLAHCASEAARGSGGPVVIPVSLRVDGPRKLGALAARIAGCGPPRAALVALTPSRFGLR